MSQQYTFIQNSETLGEIFAECLGGLVSIVGQNLKLRMNAKENTNIVRCLSQVKNLFYFFGFLFVY